MTEIAFAPPPAMAARLEPAGVGAAASDSFGARCGFLPILGQFGCFDGMPWQMAARGLCSAKCLIFLLCCFGLLR